MVNNGYMSYVENAPPDNSRCAALYALNWGKLSALTFILSSSDINYENVIAAGTVPKVVDFETVITPYFSECKNPEKNELYRLVKTGAFYKKKGALMHTCENFSESALLSREEIVRNIITGFEEVCRKAAGSIQELLERISSEKYRNFKVRCLIRHTYVYDKIGASFYSGNINDEVQYVDNICRLQNTFPKEKINIANTEIEAVLNGSVPLFSAMMYSKKLYCEGEPVCDNFFDYSMYETLKLNLENLNTNSINCASLALRHIVEEIFCENEKPCHFDKPLESIVDEVYVQTIKSAVVTSNDEAFFLKKNSDCELMPPGLYLGNAGIAYFLCEYSIIHGSKEAASVMHKTLETLSNVLLYTQAIGDTSFTNGLSGILYAFAKISKRTRSTKYEACIQEIIRKIMESANENIYDFYTGSAGIVYTLTQVDLSEEYYRQFILRADKLLNAELENDGFAHGNSGIAFALAAVFMKTGNVKYINRAVKLLEQVDLQKIHNENRKISLCSGFAGIVLAVSSVPEKFRNDNLNQILEISIDECRKTSAGNTTLCCGEAGAVLLFAKLFRQTGEQKYLKAAIKKFRCGAEEKFINLSFAFGKTGIALAALNLLHPDKTDGFL